MKRIKKTATDIFLIVLGLTFLISCSFFDKQTKKEPQGPPPKAPATSKEVQSQPKPKSKQEIKTPPPKAPATTNEIHPEQKAAPKPPTAVPPPSDGVLNQQEYYDLGMRYYSQEKYIEAKKAWQKVVKLGKKTALADKARENIKKVDQILKNLKEMSGK